jgi:hypothetical protein
MQQMHQGQLPAPSNSHDSANIHQLGGPSTYGRSPGSPPNGNSEGSYAGPTLRQSNGPSEHQGNVSNRATSLEDLLSGAAKEADRADTIATAKGEAKQDEPQEDKKAKKEKDKSTKLVYSDNDISPEEKMAQMPRYAFAPIGKEESMSGGANMAAITVTTGSKDQSL